MILFKDMMPMPYFKKAAFTGSDQGMRYRLSRLEQDGQTFLQAAVWPDLFCFDKTPEDQKIYRTFEFSREGVQAAVDWMNQTRESHFKA